MSPEPAGTQQPAESEREVVDEVTLVSEPSVEEHSPPPVPGLVRDVEVMPDGVRRITFYSRSSTDEEPT